MIVLDVETSGVDPKHHSIISIGAIEFEAPGNEFYGECKIWDGAKIMDEALAINGFTEADITDPTKQSLEILMRGFIEWSKDITDTTLAGHNLADLDIPFLKDSAFRSGLDWPFARRMVDTHTLTYMHLVQSGQKVPVANKHSNINSRFVQKYIGIPEEPTPHNALTGARVTAEAISRLLYNKPLLKEFKELPIPWLASK